MKTALYTGFDKAYSELALLTLPLMHAYALRHGIDFFPFTDQPIGPNVYWTGVCGGLQLLREGYDRVVYLDADQVVTNDLRVPWADWPASGFHVSKDWGTDATEPWHFSMCGFAAHQNCISLFESVLESEPEWRDKPFQEQGPFQHVVRKLMEDLPYIRPIGPHDPPIGMINIHPRKVFNCVPNAVCPGDVPEPWQYGDWCAHLTMVDLPKRIQLFHEIVSKLPR